MFVAAAGRAGAIGQFGTIQPIVSAGEKIIINVGVADEIAAPVKLFDFLRLGEIPPFR